MILFRILILLYLYIFFLIEFNIIIIVFRFIFLRRIGYYRNNYYIRIRLIYLSRKQRVSIFFQDYSDCK